MTVQDEAAGSVVPGRSCGSCTLCCKVLAIDEIGKPMGSWCKHCDARSGCKIHDTRPGECRSFYCGFLTGAHLGEEWRPSKSKIVLIGQLDGNRIAAHVDPGHPGAWRKEPFYSRLKEWANIAAVDGLQVLVCIGKRTIVILPDKEVDLGIIGDDELILTEKRVGPQGPVLDAIKIKRNDSRAGELQAGTDYAVINNPQRT